MKDCEIIRDLLPLYADELTSERSNEVIHAHLDICPECRAELARMRSAISVPKEEQAQNIDYKKALKHQLRHMKLKITGTTLAGILIAVVIALLVLWWNGVFYIVDRQTSPDGSYTATAYSRDVTDLLHSHDTFSIRERGTRIYSGTYSGMWWSNDSQYLLIACDTTSGTLFLLSDQQLNCTSNLNIYLNSSAVHEAFSNAQKDASLQPIISYQFIRWSNTGHEMLFYYTFIGTDGLDHAGYFGYNHETGSINGIIELPYTAARGQIKGSGTHQDGSAFYVMDLAEPDENGNTVEFVFTVTDATDIRSTQALKVGDYVTVVYQEDEMLYDFPAISVTCTGSDDGI